MWQRLEKKIRIGEAKKRGTYHLEMRSSCDIVRFVLLEPDGVPRFTFLCLVSSSGESSSSESDSSSSDNIMSRVQKLDSISVKPSFGPY